MEIKNNSAQFDFLFKLLNIFENAKDANELTRGIFDVYKEQGAQNGVRITDLKIFIYNKAAKTLKDFTKSWQNLNRDSFFEALTGAFEFFKNNQKTGSNELPKFIINGSKVISGANIADFNRDFKKYAKAQGENVMFFPLLSKEKTFGVLQLNFELQEDELKIQKYFIQILYLITSQISRAIKTLEYIDKMETSVKFYKTMKDIAKIIETQYELNYILPILGEMIDKFISQHLIYIFLKNPRKSGYTLVWPSNCLDKNIGQTLEKTASATSTVIEDKGRMGIFPIVCDEKSIGAIVAYNRFDPLTNAEIEYLEQLSSQASLTVDKATSYSKILQHATLDALTGLNNRHQFAHRLKQEVATAKRQNAPLCCIMLDVDFFKKVNDTYGHAVGDCVLKNVAKIIKKEIREYDIASRYGGEEFSILTPHTTIDEAYLIAQRLRSEIEKKKINIEEYRIEGTKTISVTISVGVSLYDKKKTDPALLYQDADKALYEAKEHGRNRVVVYGGQ